MTPEVEKLLSLLGANEKMVAMLAPSYPVDFSYPSIVGMLKRLGFNYVVEVSKGAAETNRQLIDLIKSNPEKRYITSPCPSVVRLIRNRYPDLVKFLAKIDSPMSACAKMVAKEYPDCKKVFIGPCYAKKLEAGEDCPELDILVLTYKETEEVFQIKNIMPKKDDALSSFDLAESTTRLYPISGGLAQSSGVYESMTNEECAVVSGPALVEKALESFLTKTETKLLDILFCDGGCINGRGISSTDSIEKKRERVMNYWDGLV